MNSALSRLMCSSKEIKQIPNPLFISQSRNFYSFVGYLFKLIPWLDKKFQEEAGIKNYTGPPRLLRHSIIAINYYINSIECMFIKCITYDRSTDLTATVFDEQICVANKNKNGFNVCKFSLKRITEKFSRS